MGFCRWGPPGGSLQVGPGKVCVQANKGEWLEGLREGEKLWGWTWGWPHGCGSPEWLTQDSRSELLVVVFEVSPLA